MESIRVIKSASDHEAALREAERLVALDPALGTPEAERLELLAVLIEDYEKRQFPFESPDPISAVEFRMEEQGLRQKDLVPLIGSRSRVSEVLARKRSLTVPMIRALSTGLGIPADVLVIQPKNARSRLNDVTKELDWSQFPVQEMKKRGWFSFADRAKKRSTEELVKEFFAEISSEPALALYRRRFHGEALSDRNRYSVLAWTARVLLRAKREAAEVPAFRPDQITPDILRDLARLSSFEAGPRLAVEFLRKRGIVMIVEPKLPYTLLDGAALLTERGQAVVGLTLRHDRVDAFWFTLLHEVVHIWKHLSSALDAFVDRIENSEPDDVLERDANRIARESLIPRGIWRRSSAYLSPTRENIERLANELGIAPGLVVGRLHYETGNYRLFNEYVRYGSVSKHFTDDVPRLAR